MMTLNRAFLITEMSQAGGDVAHRGAFLLRLLHAAVHEHRAATAQVNGVFSLNGGLRELGNVQVQARCEAFDEAEPQPEEHASFSMMWSITPSFTRRHFMSWPPMSENELDARQHFLSAAQVRDRFDFARVNAQGLQQQRFAVAGYRRMTDGHLRLAGFVNRELRRTVRPWRA